MGTFDVNGSAGISDIYILLCRQYIDLFPLECRGVVLLVQFVAIDDKDLSLWKVFKANAAGGFMVIIFIHELQAVSEMPCFAGQVGNFLLGMR